MFDLKELFRVLGLPIGLVAVVVALLAWAGTPIEQIAGIAAALVGLQALGSFGVDALKYVGLVNAGDAGKWSAGWHLVTLVLVAVQLRFFPAFDLAAFDLQVGEFVKIIALVFAYVVQMIGSKQIHVYSSKLGLAYRF